MGVALMTRRDPYRRAMRRVTPHMAEPRRRLPDPHHRNRRTGRRNRGRDDRPVGIPAPVGLPAVPDHQRGIRHGRVHPSPSCPVVDHHGVRDGLRHGAAGHSAQAAVGTPGRPVHLRDYWPGCGPRAESTARPNGPTGPSSSRPPADGLPPLSRSARPCGHCRRSPESGP